MARYHDIAHKPADRLQPCAGGLSIVDHGNGQVLKTLPVGREPEGVTLSPDGKLIFVTSEDEATVTVVDVAAASEVKKIKVGLRPRGVAFLPDGSRAYVTNENGASLSVIDVAKLEGKSTIPLGDAL